MVCSTGCSEKPSSMPGGPASVTSPSAPTSNTDGWPAWHVVAVHPPSPNVRRATANVHHRLVVSSWRSTWFSVVRMLRGSDVLTAAARMV